MLYQRKKIAVPKGSFIFADGTYCEIDKNAILLPKAIPSEFLELGEKVDVYIGLKEFSENSANVTEINNKEEAADCNTRYIGFYEGKEVCDLYGQGLPSYVDVIKYNLQIVFATELDKYNDYSLIKICEVYKDGTRIVMNDQYVPPIINIYNDKILSDIMNDISSLIVSKTRQFEKFKHVRGGSISGYEIMILNLISQLSQSAAIFQIMQSSNQEHPYHAWKKLSEVEALLSSYTDTISSVEEEKRFPKYEHDNLFYVFDTLRSQLRNILGSISVGPEYIIKFNRGENNIWYADLPDLSKLDNISVFLAMSGSGIDANTITLSFYSQLKFASKDAIEGLIIRSLGGIPLSLTTSIPGGLPTLEQGFYSSVDVHSELWFDVVSSRKPAFLWEGPQDANLIMYVIRNQ